VDVWERPDPARVIRLATTSDWQQLARLYPTLAGRPQRPFDRCLEVARQAGARSVVIETRYIDRDFRSDYAAHHSRSFLTIPGTTHRLHFFSRAIARQHLARLPSAAGYLGYMVIRPREVARVGRSVLVPPPALDAGLRVRVIDNVDLFGQPLTVEGAPFMAQDREFLRCAHVDAWMCHYSAALRGDLGRRNSAWFALNAQPGLGRPVPSPGLNLFQVSELLRTSGLPSVLHDIEQLPRTSTALTLHWVPSPTPPAPTDPNQHPGYWDYRIIRVCCRYLNSDLPIIVATAGHVFVLVGYRRVPRAGMPDWIELMRHDDEVGPYTEVGDIFSDPEGYTPWQWIIAPLPERIWLSGELAEYVAGRLLEVRSSAWSAQVPTAGEVSSLIASRDLSLHTYVTLSTRFKRGLAARGMDQRLAREYRLSRMPRYVWVVEAVDRRLRSSGRPPVVGEVILDATSTDMDWRVVAVHLPGVAAIYRTNGRVRFPIQCGPRPYMTGGVGPP
jgi:hypothetical protein